MRKIIIKSTITFVLFVITFTLSAQSGNYKVLEKIKTNLSNVEDVKVSDWGYIVLTDNSIYTLNLKGKVKESYAKGNIKGISYDKKRNKLYSINSENKLDKDGKQLKHLAKSNNNMYSCKIIGSGSAISYSSKLVSIDEEGNETLFVYMVGIPTGMYCDDNFLYYLYNKSKKDEEGVLQKYDLITGLIIFEEIIPVKDPSGLDINTNGDIYTFSPTTNEIIKLRRIQ